MLLLLLHDIVVIAKIRSNANTLILFECNSFIICFYSYNILPFHHIALYQNLAKDYHFDPAA